mmetsp:Transcript_55112/g.144976  ORF Transcript_55112/g.144976 Transcript_55112/m.144976 type:complete len:209 (+) Transcript_55112:256-882(+)
MPGLFSPLASEAGAGCACVRKLSAPASLASTFLPSFCPFWASFCPSRNMRGVTSSSCCSPSWGDAPPAAAVWRISLQKPEICFRSSWPRSATCFPSSLGVSPSWPGGMRSLVAAWIVDQPSVSCCRRRCAAGLSSKGRTARSPGLRISISPPMFSLTGPASSRGLILSQRRAAYSTGPSPSRRGSTRLSEVMLSFLSSFIMKSMVPSR